MSSKTFTRNLYTGSEKVSFVIDSKLVKSHHVQALLMDIGHNLEMALNLVRNKTIRVMHDNIIEQTPDLSEYQKQVVSFFCNYADAEILHMAACGKVQDTELSDKILMEVLSIRLKKTIKHFLKNSILPHMDLSSPDDGSSWEQQIEQKMQQFQQDYPQAKSSIRYKYKSKSFIKEMSVAYCDHYFKYLDKILPEYEKIHATPILEKDKDTDLFNLYVGWAIHFCNADEHVKQYKKYYINTIKELMQKSHNDVVDRRAKEILAEEIRKQKIRERSQISNTLPTITKDEEATQLSPLIQAKLDAIQQKLQDTINTQIQGLFAYIKRMAKVGKAVRVETIVEYMGSQYTIEAYNAILEALEAAGIDIETKKDAEIQQLVTGKKATDDVVLSPQETKTKTKTKTDLEPKYPTLEEVRANPKLLTAPKLVQILKEMGFIFYEENKFIKEAAGYLLDGSVKKQVISALSKTTEIIRDNRSFSKGGTYQRIDLHDRTLRVVKIGKCILRFTDFQTYQRRLEFDMKDIMTELSTDSKRTSRYTAEDLDQLSLGA